MRNAIRPEPSLTLGVERLIAEEELLGSLSGRCVGVIANPTSVDRKLVHTVDHLLAAQERGGFEVTALFGPEHGIHAAAPATQPLASGEDARTGIPVWSLYSGTTLPSVQALASVDVLVFDLQDVGVRFYTFIWTLYQVMAAAAREGKAVVVLDRPNPLGDRIDGPMLDSTLRSFVGMHPIPLQHGLTVGELARLFADEFLDDPLDLTVIAMTGYEADRFTTGWGMEWVSPSPNLPHRSSVWAHAASGLIDGTTASQGVGTALPFEWVGHPSIDDPGAHGLAAELNALALPGVTFRAMMAIPAMSKGAGELCGGVQLHIRDPGTFRPARVSIHLLSVLRRGSRTRWLPASNLHAPGDTAEVLWIDLLSGDRGLRARIDAGDNPDAIVAEWEEAATRFERDVAPHRLYASSVGAEIGPI